MNSKLTGLGVVALALASGTAQAEISSTVTVISDYDFRGLTQTELDPALQASLDWSGDSGLYAGVWGSNVDFGDGAEGSNANLEVDFILGYGGSFTEKLGYDFGATYYAYFGEDSDVPSVDYWEIHGGLSYTEHASTTIWYAEDYGHSDKSAWYLEGNGDVPLPWWELGVTLHAGYSAGDYWSSDDDEYYDFSVGLTRSFGHFDMAVKYVDGSNLEDFDCSRSTVDCGGNPTFSSESKVVLSVATTFPWAKAE